METPITDQNPLAVFAKEEQIISFVQSAFPTLDMTPGTAIRDLVIRIYAHLELRIQEQIDLALISSSLLEISKNPNLIDSTQVDRVLSNYNITRSTGTTATGKIRLFFTTSDSVVLDENVEFTVNELSFTPTESLVLLNAANYTAAANQRLITPSGTAYTVLIDVTAVAAGAAGNVRSGSLVSSISASFNGFISAKVDSDFTGGSEVEDNVALLAKLKAGVVGKIFDGREHIAAKLKNKFPGVVDVGCVGFLDEGMTRDLVDGIHTGGRVDVYVKSSSYPTRIQEQITPKFVSWDPAKGAGIFEFTFDSTKASGLYTVESIKTNLYQLGSLAIVLDSRTFEDSGYHLVQDPSKSCFSALQRITIKFSVPYANLVEAWNDPLTLIPAVNSITVVQTKYTFYVEYLRMPDLSEIQAYVDSAPERSLSAELLVLAPVPALCSVQLKLLKSTGAAVIDEAKLKAAIVNKFNSYSFGEAVSGSALVHVAYNNLPAGYTIDLPIHMYGVIINPDLTKDVIFSSDSLHPPVASLKGVTGNNLAFFLEANLVDISVRDC